MPKQSTTFLHIGLPKTGTTFLQGMLAANADVLAAHGLVYPGRSKDHFLAAQDALGHDFRGHSDERTAGSWESLLRELAEAPESAIVSHELFSLATDEAIARILDQLPTSQVVVVVTARDFLRQVPAVWQEDLKNGKARTLTEFVALLKETDGASPAKGFWRYQDLPAITERWAKQVGNDKVIVVTVPPVRSSQLLLWERFTSSVQLETPDVRIPEHRKNTSLGSAEAEFLRRLNVQLADDLSWPEYRKFVKHTLVRQVLANSPNEMPITLAPADAVWAVERSRRMAHEIERRGYRTIGDITDLVSPEPPARDNIPSDVQDSDITAVGVSAVSGLLDTIDRINRKERKVS